MTGPEESPIEAHIEQPTEQPEFFRDAFGIKELQTMLEEEKLDVDEVLQIIEQELEDSAPDPEDIEASEEYKLKMHLLDQLAQRQVGRSAVLRGIQERIHQKLEQLTNTN